MLKFHMKKDEQFECELKLEGVEYQKLQPRLILIPDGDKKMQFEGIYKNSKCFVPVFIKDTVTRKGLAILEIVIDSKEYIRPWSSPYEIIGVNIIITETKVVEKPKKIIHLPAIKKEDIHTILDQIESKKENVEIPSKKKITLDYNYLDTRFLDEIENSAK